MDSQVKKLLEIGEIVNTHGLKGEVKVNPWCDSPQVLCDMKRVYVHDRPVKVLSARQQKNTVLMLLDGVDSIEKAASICGVILYVDRDDITLEEGRHFIQDIIGCEVYDIDTKQMYGVVSDVFKTGANDVYQITDESSKNFLLPVIPDVVLKVDIEDRKIFIRPLKGIFDDED